MTKELLQKIQRVLDRRIRNEMQVVYLLVEVRKLIDREAYKDPVLRMFTNWVLHTSLDNRADGSTLILCEFDNLVSELYEKKKLLRQTEHISLGTFRDALIRCFGVFGLSASFVHNVSDWKRFSRLYCLVISECPIVFTASKMRLRYIKQIELQGVERGISLKEWPIVQWRLTLQDGTTQNWGFHLG
jgi:hypothetical protein